MMDEERPESVQTHQWNTMVFEMSSLRAGIWSACIIGVGVLLLTVGCFITAHAYQDQDESHAVLAVMGPTLLALGGLLIIIPLLAGIVVFIRNKRNVYTLNQHIGGDSAFYNDLIDQIENSGTDLQSSVEYQKLSSSYTESKTGTIKADALRFLADTVVEERSRTNKNSMILFGSGIINDGEFTPTNSGPSSLIDSTGWSMGEGKSSTPVLEHPKIRILSGDCQNTDSVLECLGLPNEQSITRARSNSFAASSNGSPTIQKLKRTATYSPKRHQHIKPPSQNMSRSSSSKRKKPKETNEDVVVVHSLPSPSILDALGLSQSGVEMGSEDHEQKGGINPPCKNKPANLELSSSEAFLSDKGLSPAMGVATLRRYSKRKKKNPDTTERKDSSSSAII